MKRGHLEELRPGKWRFRLAAGSFPDGKPRPYRSSTFAASGQRAAEKVASRLCAEWDTQAAEQEAAKGTVGELVGEWILARAKKDSPATVYRRTAITNRIAADLGRMRLGELTARHIDGWYRTLAEGDKTHRPLAPSTVNHYHRVLHAVLRQGWKWDMVAANVADKASPPSSRKADQAGRMPTPAAVGVMLGLASPTVRMAVVLGGGTGARRGELVGLRWSDLDGNRLTISRSLVKVPGKELIIKTTKTDTIRTVPLSASVMAELAVYRRTLEAYAVANQTRLADDGPILPHTRKDPTGRTPFAPEWLSQEWERLCDRAKVPRFKLHGLRHMHGSMLVEAGVGVATAAKRQGHTVATMQDSYLHAVDGSDDAAALAVEAWLAPLLALPAGTRP